MQWRAKTWTLGPSVEAARALVGACALDGARLIVNDRADVARLAGAAGVHVGQEDLPPRDARRILAPDQVVGVSAHNCAQVEAAIAAGADYVAIGPVFDTTGKVRPDPVVGLDGVRGAAVLAQAEGVPLVAIGGITLDRAPAVIDAGADAVAVIGDLLAGTDLKQRAEHWVRQLAAHT